VNIIHRARELEELCQGSAHRTAVLLLSQPSHIRLVGTRYETVSEYFVFTYVVDESEVEIFATLEIRVECQEYMKLLAVGDLEQSEYEHILMSGIGWIRSKRTVYGAGLD
jgi:hypothetical protein